MSVSPGRVPLERVGAQAGAQLAHEGRGAQPVAGDVADGQADAAAGELDDVVPVAADLVAGREVARRGLDADEVGEAVGQQAALQGDRAAMLAIERVEEPRAVDRRCRLAGGELEQRRVVIGELARRDRADVQHADDDALDQHRDAEQRAYALHAQDRVEDLGVVDVGDVDRRAAGRDAAREAPADRDPHAALDLLLEALGGARDELLRLLVEEQDRGGVHAEDLLRARQQLVEQRLERELGERRVREPVDVLELARGLVERRLLADAEEDLAVSRLGNQWLRVGGAHRGLLYGRRRRRARAVKVP